jgi:hypothetical protein
MSDKPKRILFAFYSLSIAAMFGCYFLLPAPERWFYVVRAFKEWPVFLRGH